MFHMLMNTELVLGFLGNPTELIVIFAIILLLFGGSKLPELARSLGKAQRAFREEASAMKREIEAEAMRDDQKKSAEAGTQTKAASTATAAPASTNSGSTNPKN
jgi:TatA/E family protein of Tat protein translocase